MTEEEAEKLDLISSTELSTIIDNAKLDPDLANEFHINFYEHFKMANEWSKKAKTIIVTNENQTVLMEQARVARLFIRSKRLEIENFRKSKKEYYLRGGQAIDKVCTFLKNMIEPIENHLDLQEHYVEYKKKAEDARLLAEAQAKAEQERLLKEEADRKALELAQAENERLRKEQTEREKVLQAERAIQEAKIAKERAIQEAQLAKERAEREKVEAELRAKKQAEEKYKADELRKKEALKIAVDSVKMQKFYDDLMTIQFPEVTSNEAKKIIYDAKSHIGIVVMSTKRYIQLTVQEEE